jgi:guanylate kinase
LIKKLFLIDGLAGAGKSDLLEFVERSHSRNATIVSKFSTRSRRHPEEATRTDLKFVSEKKFAELATKDFYVYEYAGKRYGFSKSDVLRALDTHEHVFIIIRSRSLVEKLRKEFSEMAVVLPFFIYADRGLIVHRLQQDGFDKDTINSRLERSSLSWKDYLEYPDSSMRVVINNSEKTDFHRKVNSLLDEFSTERIDSANELYINPSLKFELIKPLRGFKEDINRHLADSPYHRNIFVMMKFRDSNSTFFAYIKTEIERAGFACVRADAPEWNVTNNVYNPLAALYCCKYGIALFDEAEPDQAYNANVAYELGIMHNQGKQCLILKHDSLPSVPFDLVKDLRKTYSKEIDFQRLFTQWLIEIRQETKTRGA